MSQRTRKQPKLAVGALLMGLAGLFQAPAPVRAAPEPPSVGASQPSESRHQEREEVAALLEAAEAGEARAQFDLGWKLQYDVDRDTHEAAVWYRRAAERGYGPAMVALGKLYGGPVLGVRDFITRAEGEGPDCEEAARWLRLAAAQDDALGAFYLGVLHAEGCGVPQDDALAYFWLSVAAELAAGDDAREWRQELSAWARSMPEEAVAAARRLLAEWEKPRETTLDDEIYLLGDSFKGREAGQRIVELGPVAVPELTEALGRASSRTLLQNIAFVLYRLGPQAREAAPELERRLGTEPPGASSRAFLAAALARADPQRGSHAVPDLEHCLADEGWRTWILLMCLHGLDSVGGDAGLEVRIGLLGASDPVLRAAAAEGLAAAEASRRLPLQLEATPLDALQLVLVGRREEGYYAVVLPPGGAPEVVQAGTRFLDGEVGAVDGDGLDLVMRRARDDLSIETYPRRLELFPEAEPPPVPPEVEGIGFPVSVDFAGDLGGLVLALAVGPGLDLILEAGVDGDARISARAAPWDGVLEHAIEAAGLAYRLDSNVMRIGRPEELDGRQVPADREPSGDLVSFTLRQEALEDVVRVLGTVFGVTIELPPGPHQPLTMAFLERPWDQVLDFIVASRGWAQRREGDRIVIERPPPGR